MRRSRWVERRPLAASRGIAPPHEAACVARSALSPPGPRLRRRRPSCRPFARMPGRSALVDELRRQAAARACEPLPELAGWQWGSDQIALHRCTTELSQHVELLLRFDALADR